MGPETEFFTAFGDQQVKSNHFKRRLPTTLTVSSDVDLKEANEMMNRLIIGNDDTKEKLLIRIARLKIGEEIRPIGMSGPPKSGKKHITKIFSQILGCAYVEIDCACDYVAETTLDEWKVINV